MSAHPLLFADAVAAEPRGAMVAITLGEGDAARTFVLSLHVAERLQRMLIEATASVRAATGHVVAFKPPKVRRR